LWQLELKTYRSSESCSGSRISPENIQMLEEEALEIKVEAVREDFT
jgi:hypothetical protein